MIKSKFSELAEKVENEIIAEKKVESEINCISLEDYLFVLNAIKTYGNNGKSRWLLIPKPEDASQKNVEHTDVYHYVHYAFYTKVTYPIVDTVKDHARNFFYKIKGKLSKN